MQDEKEQLEQAREQVEFFAEKYSEWHGVGHLILARHAAFPVSVTVDLLYQLWANFKVYPDEEGREQLIPMLAVSDLILSSLFRQTGRDVYEMQPPVRAYLLSQLKEDERFGELRLQQLASFLYRYIREQPDRPEWKNFKEAQRWTALLTTDPQLAAAQVLQSLVNKVGNTQVNASIGIANMMEAFAKNNKAFTEEVANHMQSREDLLVTAPATPDNAITKKLVLADKAVAGSIPFPINLPPYISNRLTGIKTVVEERVSTKAEPPGTVYGLFVGISAYSDSSLRLQSAGQDAINLAACLREQGLVKEEHTRLLLNAEATKAAFQTGLENMLASARSEDHVLIYFSGHALNSLENSSLVLADFYSTSSLSQSIPSNSTTLVDEFNGWINRERRTHPTVILILDTHAGNRHWLNETDPKHILIMACHLTQHAGEIATGGYFTMALINAIRESHGLLTYKNLYKKVCQYLEQYQSLLSRQTPLFVTSQWDTYIFKHKKINSILPVQLLLRDFGYDVNTDGIDGPQAKAAKQAFMIAHDIDKEEALRFYLELKNKVQQQGAIQVLVVASNDLIAMASLHKERYRSKLDGYRSKLDAVLQAEHSTVVYHPAEDLFTASPVASQDRSDDFIEKLLGSCAVIILQKDQNYTTSFTTRYPDLEMLVELAFALDKEIFLIVELIGKDNYRFFDRLVQLYRPAIRDYIHVNFSSGADSIIRELTGYHDFLQKLLTINRKKSTRTLDASYTEAIESARQTGRLDISNQNLPEIPAPVFELGNLEELHAEGNRIKEIPPAIAQLTQLKVLNLNGNPITVLPPELLELRNLETLSLSNTDLQELPTEINKLESLQQLYIHGTRLAVLPDALAELKKLKVLDARENHILNVPQAALRGKTAPKKFRAYVKSFLPSATNPAVILLTGNKDLHDILDPRLSEKFPVEVHTGEVTPVVLYEALRKGVADHCLIYIADTKKIFEQFAFPDQNSWQRNSQQFFGLLNGRKINIFYDQSAFSVYMIEDLPGIPVINAVISPVAPSSAYNTDGFVRLFFKQYLAGNPISESYAYSQQHIQNKKDGNFPTYTLYKNSGFVNSKLPSVKMNTAPDADTAGLPAPEKVSHKEEDKRIVQLQNSPYKFKTTQRKEEGNEKLFWKLLLVDREGEEILVVEEEFIFYKQLIKRLEQIRQSGADRANFVTGKNADGYMVYSIKDGDRTLATGKRKFRVAKRMEAEINRLVRFFSYDKPAIAKKPPAKSPKKRAVKSRKK